MEGCHPLLTGLIGQANEDFLTLQVNILNPEIAGLTDPQAGLNAQSNRGLQDEVLALIKQFPDHLHLALIVRSGQMLHSALSVNLRKYGIRRSSPTGQDQPVEKCFEYAR